MSFGDKLRKNSTFYHSKEGKAQRKEDREKKTETREKKLRNRILGRNAKNTIKITSNHY